MIAFGSKQKCHMNKTILESYLNHLTFIKNYQPISSHKVELLLNKIEGCLGKPLLEAHTGSEIEQAIIKAAEKRKRAYNGGRQNSGEYYRFRCGNNAAMFYSWAFREEIILRNPYSRNTFRKPVAKEADFLTDQELDIVLNNPHITQFERTLMYFLLDTAMRREELIKAKLKDVDFEKRTVYIPEAKGFKSRTVPFTENTKQLILNYLEYRGQKSEYVFTLGEDEGLAYYKVGAIFQSLSMRLNIHLHPHLFRHTATRLWYDSNIDSMIIAMYLGHESVLTTRRYSHMSAGRLNEFQEMVYARKKARPKTQEQITEQFFAAKQGETKNPCTFLDKGIHLPS